MHQLPSLPYDYNALEPYLDEATMRIHHLKHHQAYIDKLNAALEKYPDLSTKSVEELLTDLQSLPEDIKQVVINNGGGHYNHSLFWSWLKPHGGEPPAGILKLLERDFKDFANFKRIFKDTALNRFGSGWTWLTQDQSGKLAIVSTPNQDNPIMVSSLPGSPVRPILGLDVWEHAYYLQYQNQRADYIDAWWSVINWERVEELLDA